jgi:hypothetical protein
MNVIPDNFSELVRQLVAEKYSHGLKGNKRIYTAPNFPARKLSNVLKTYAEGVSVHDVLMLFDNTVLGGAKEGFLLTDEALYWNNMQGLFHTLKLTALDHVMCERSATVSELVLNGSERIRTGLLGEEVLEGVVAMLNDIISLKSGLDISEDTSDGPDVNIPEEATPVVEEPVKKGFVDTIKEIGDKFKEDRERTPGLHKLPRLGDPTGRARQEIEELLGPPNSLSAAPGGYLAQWISLEGHLALLFNKDDVCKGIAHHLKII